MKRTKDSRGVFVSLLLLAMVGAQGGCDADSAGPAGDAKSIELLNVSYDPTRELWRQINEKFEPNYRESTGIDVRIRQSHGGSSSQASSVIDGLEADVVTLALWTDTDAIRKAGLIAEGWEDRLPNRSLPYTSTIVFVVRKGNPKQINDWPDLVRNDVEIVTPNPKTSGNGKLSFLAAWGAIVTRGGSEQEAEAFVTQLFRHAPVLDTGARAATITFAQKGIGDVHLTWENEAYLEVQEAKGALELVYPPVSIRAEPPVTVVDQNVDRKGSRAAAQAYLEFLYTDVAQNIIAENRYRPSNPEVLARHADKFPQLTLFEIGQIAQNWADANERFFAEGAVFDRIYQPTGK
ncbi:MAG: sulfate ABC transporter substrate-binding protein [Planctomycetaceae bacterium]|nr:sulfate ABC transporter substrate-binding protein [Planctomycetaceae bacterium]